MATKRKTTKAPEAVAPENHVTKLPKDDPLLWEVSFSGGYAGPSEAIVSLPGGGKKRMNRFQDDEEAEDFPLLEITLRPSDAAELRGHGWGVVELKKSKSAANPLSTPEELSNVDDLQSADSDASKGGDQ